jgi:hypothetical protein
VERSESIFNQPSVVQRVCNEDAAKATLGGKKDKYKCPKIKSVGPRVKVHEEGNMV